MTCECLESIDPQLVDEIIIVDNSACETEAAALAIGVNSTRSTIGHSIEIVTPPKNLGFGRGVNLAVAIARNKWNPTYYLVINNDAKLQAGALEALISHMNRHRDCAACGPQILTEGGLDLTNSIHYYLPTLAIISKYHIPHSTPYLMGCCLLVRASNFVHGDIFDEDFFMYGEDVELSLRIAKNKLEIAVVESASAIHTGSASSKNGSPFYEHQLCLSHMILFDKFYAQKKRSGIIRKILNRAALLTRALIRSYRSKSLVPLNSYRKACTDYRSSQKKNIKQPTT
jgi:hypothetical protein